MDSLKGGRNEALQFWKYERHNCALCSFLTLAEVLLTANDITWNPDCTLGTVLADRAAMVDGNVSEALRNCQKMCLSVYGYNVDQTDKLEGCWFLPMIFHGDLPDWLGNDGSAIAPFSSVRVKRGPVKKVTMVPGPSGSSPALVRNRVTVLTVLTDRGDSVLSAFEEFLPAVVGDLPLLVHVEMRAGIKPGLRQVPHTIECNVHRMDEDYMKVEKTVTYVFAGAACYGGTHFNSIVVTGDGVLYDYDCMLCDGRLRIRVPADSVTSKQGYTFTYAVYRLSVEVDVPCKRLKHVPSATSTSVVKCSRKRPAAEPNAVAVGAMPTLTLGLPSKNWTQRRNQTELSELEALQNLTFLRTVTGERGYRRVSASGYEGDLTSLKEDALELAARVLHFQTLTGHPVHGPRRPTMYYHKFDGVGTGGATVAPVSPVAKESRFCDIHDRLLQFAMRGVLQDSLAGGSSQVVQSGYLIENVKPKETRGLSAFNYETITRWTQVAGEKTYRRDRTDVGWVTKLQEASSGNTAYSWPIEGMVEHSPHPEGLCHVDTHDPLDEGMVVVILLLTPHGGNFFFR